MASPPYSLQLLSAAAAAQQPSNSAIALTKYDTGSTMHM